MFGPVLLHLTRAQPQSNVTLTPSISLTSYCLDKAYSFTFDFVKYYYITDLHDLNKSEENLFISKFDSEKTENDNNFEINYFTIIKNVSEFNSGEGNYLVIFDKEGEIDE